MNKQTKQKVTKIMQTVAQPVAETVQEAVAENKDVKKPSFLGSIAKAGLEVAKQALPTALSLVPGVGPVLSSLSQGLLSTMNDDEWFSEFRSAGATFNEMLACTQQDGDKTGVSDNAVNLSSFVGAVGAYRCHFNLGPDIKGNVFPAFLNYVRSKTENVLVDDTDKYWYSIGDTIQLYAIYYNIMKYLKFAESLPLNAPTLPDALVASNPLINSQIAGIASTLRDFLKTSTGIPYALREYIRWRFGTAFLSENSAKAGIILYDIDTVYTPTASYTIPWIGQYTGTIKFNVDALVTQLTDAINALKTDILLQGRANADVALAFKNHVARYDVEERHYDEKEFNLRCNLTSDGQIAFTAKDHNRLLLDSRLDINAAIQAVTLSTRPRGDVDPVKFINEVNDHGYTQTTPDSAFIHVTDTIILTNTVSLATSNNRFIERLLSHRFQGTHWAFFSLLDTSNWNTGIGGYAPVPAAFVSYPPSGAQNIEFNNLGLDTRQATTVLEYVNSWVYKILSISLQMHYNDCVFSVGFSRSDRTTTSVEDLNYLQIAPLAYDTAEVTDNQLAAIQRCAVRNLFRGTYSQKEPVKPQVAEAVGDIVAIATDDASIKTVK